jgi:hypothetical protein
MNLCPQSFRVIVQFSTHVLELLHDKAGMMKERRSRRRQLDASPPSQQERRAKIDLHVADSLAGGSQSHVRAKGPAGDVQGVRHVQEQAKVSEIESLSHRMGAFSLA